MGTVATQSRTEVHIDLDKFVDDVSTTKVLKVGWPEKIRYPEEYGGEYVAQAAATNEYGNPLKRIPPRPFLGPAVANNKAEWIELIKAGIRQVIKGNGTIETVLEKVGSRAAGDVSEAIIAVTSPGLSKRTIANRMSRLSSKKVTSTIEKPLVDSGLMLRSVTHVVEKE